MVLVRAYRPCEYDALKAILEESGHFDPDLDSPENLRCKVERQPYSLLVAESDGGIVGCAYSLCDGVRALLRLTVRADLKDNGVVSDLIRAAEDSHRKEGAGKVSFWVGEDSRLFAALLADGYEPGGIRKSMSKRL